MLNLNFKNIEELVFYDTELQKKLPIRYFSIFEQWRIAKRVPLIAGLGKQAILDLLNTLNEEDIDILEDYFGQKIIVEKLNYGMASNITIPLADSAEICNKLCEVSDFNYFSTWRDNEHLYISFWR